MPLCINKATKQKENGRVEQIKFCFKKVEADQ
jgi:hypothetical protein